MRSLKNRVTLVSSVLLLVSLWGMTFAVTTWQLQDLKTLLGNQQFATASVIADQIGDQISTRVKALEAVATIISDVQMSSLPLLQDWLEKGGALSILFNGGYFVTNADGVATASVPLSANRRGLDYWDRDQIRTALAKGRSSVGEVVLGRALKAPVFSIGVPVRNEAGRVVGTLVGVTDLSKPNFLDRIEQLGNVQGGYLLVASDQRLVVTATDKSRAMEKLAPPGADPKVDRFVAGGEGTDVLVTPKGEEMLVAVKQIPEAHWYLVANNPTSMVFQPALDLQNWMLWLATVLTLMTGAVNWLVLRHQLSPIETTIKTLSYLTESGRPSRPLPVARRDEIGKLIESFNRLLLALEEREAERSRYEALWNRTQRLESVGVLAAGIAHDFNNLLGGIYGNIELALLDAADSAAAPHLERTLATLDRARSMTRQMLTFSKGGLPELETAGLFPFVEDTARFAIGTAAVNCVVKVEHDLWPCRYDRNQLGQVIDNLVINALQAMPSGGTLTLTATNIESQGVKSVELCVEDTGIGMPHDILEHIFDPFFTTKAQGHGLGLTTCFSIVRQHGGHIEVTSEPNQGTTFWITLPAAVE